MMIKNTTLSFLVLTSMLSGSSAICMNLPNALGCEYIFRQSDCEKWVDSCFWSGETEGEEALLSLEAAADDPNYDHKLLRGGQLAKLAIRLDSRENNGDNTIPSFVKHLFQVDNDSEKSCCGECWCIPNGGECPASTNYYPQVYTNEMINDFSSKVLVHPDTYEVVTSNNLYELDCDPFDGVSEDSSPPWTAYQNTACRLYPEQNFESTTDVGYSDAVCAFKHPTEGDCNTYTYKTYRTRQEAEGDDAFVTHATQCGACSSAQDLSVYMKETDLTAAGTECTIKGIFGIGRSVDCYMNLGFTKVCATVWAYNSQHTLQNCLLCGLPGASAAPSSECELDPCVQCDAEKSGPTFNAYSGRTRRNSGIRSELVRSCSSIENIQQYTCSDMILPDEEETSLCAV